MYALMMVPEKLCKDGASDDNENGKYKNITGMEQGVVCFRACDFFNLIGVIMLSETWFEFSNIASVLDPVVF